MVGEVGEVSENPILLPKDFLPAISITFQERRK